MNIQHIKGFSHYFKSPTNVGALVDGKNVILIDSGNDTDKGKKLYKAMEADGLHLKGIWNTHSHADHWGGNHYLQGKTGCRIWSSKIEAAMINNNILEPFYLYGAEPLKVLKNKFLMAKECSCEIFDSDFVDFEGNKIEIVDLKGHSPGMLGFRTQDGVFFTGDALFSPEIIDKYKLMYSSDITCHLKTLELLEESDAEYYVLSHGEICEAAGLKDLIEKNRNAIDRVNEILIDAMTKPASLEELMLLSMEKLGVSMNIGQYFLNRTTISAHISHLCNEGYCVPAMDKNRLVYTRK